VNSKCSCNSKKQFMQNLFIIYTAENKIAHKQLTTVSLSKNKGFNQ
jgi:hypothetical protein